MVKRIFESVVGVLFGEWNGIQIFLIPMTIFYLLDGLSVAHWISGLLTHRIHYLPLTIFLFLLLYVIFVILKRISFDFELNASIRGKRTILNFVIELHKQLIILVFMLVMVFMLSAFLKYFYNIHIHIRYIFLYITQVFCVMMIVYHYIMNMWLKYYLKAGYSRKRAWACLLIFMRKDLGIFIRYSISLVLIMILSVYLYRALILLIIAPGLDLITGTTGLKLQFHVSQYIAGSVVLGNVWVLFVAFLTSNLLFSPIVKILHNLIQSYHPLKSAAHRIPPSQMQPQADVTINDKRV